MTFRKIFRLYIVPMKGKLVLYLGIGMFTTILGLFVTYLSGRFIDLLIDLLDFSIIIKFAVFVAFLRLINLLASYLEQRAYMSLQIRSGFAFNKDLIEHFQNIPYLNTLLFDKASLVQRLNNDSNSLIIFIISVIRNALCQLLILLGSLFFILIKAPYLACLSLILSLAYVGVYRLMRERLFRASKEMVDAQTDFFAASYRQLDHLKTIKIQALATTLKKHLFRSFDILYKTSFENLKVNYSYGAFDVGLGIFIEASIFVIGGFLVFKKKLSIGEFTILSSFFYNIIESIKYFFNIGSESQAAKAMLSRVNEILDIKRENFGKIKLDNIEKVEIKNLTFSFGENNLFKNFSYSFTKGNIYFLKGINGRGKSSLLNLIVGLYPEAYDGEILFNEINIKELDTFYLRKNLIAFTEQDPILLDDEAFENTKNVKIFKNTNSPELKSFLKDEISGGENQRLAILSALCKNADLLLFDEPTSNLDEKSKQIFLEYLQEIKKDKIILLISHENLENFVYELVSL